MVLLLGMSLYYVMDIQNGFVAVMKVGQPLALSNTLTAYTSAAAHTDNSLSKIRNLQ